MNKIPIKYVIELGLIRKRNKCAKCDKEMDVPDYNIQLCHSCRLVELDKYTKSKEESKKEIIIYDEAGFLPSKKSMEKANKLFKKIMKEKKKRK